MGRVLLLILFAILFRLTAEQGFSNLLLWLYVSWGLVTILVPIRSQNLMCLVISAVVIRSLMVGMPLVFSDDLFRYLWEGRLILEGGNPYLTAPADFSVTDGIREHVNHPSVAAIYPPFAQGVFALISAVDYRPIAMQVFFGSVDVCTVYGIWRLVHQSESKLSTSLAWLYALHPISVVESAGMAHLDVLAISLVVWGLVYHQQTPWWWWVAAGVKVFPIVMLPMLRKWHWFHIVGMFLGTLVVLGYFWDDALIGIHPYVEHWSFNSFLFAIFALVHPIYARWACIVIAGLSSLYSIWKVRQSDWSVSFGWFWIGATFVLCSPTVHPWYALWVWVPSLLQRKVSHWPWTVLVTLMPTAYVALHSLDPETGHWSPPIWPSLMMYGILCLLVVLTTSDVTKRLLQSWGIGAPQIGSR